MQPMHGIFLMVSAVTIFVAMAGFIKAAPGIPAGEAVFFRSAGALPVIIVWLAMRGDLPAGLRTRNWRNHAVRSLVGSFAMGLGFAGLKFLPLPDITAIRFVTPILIVVFAALILGERLRLIRITAVAMGLVGVTIIVWPQLTFGGDAPLGVLLTLGSASCAALAQIFIKSMAGTEKTGAIVFYFSATAATLSLLSLPFGWVWPEGMEWAWLLGAGLLGGLGQILLTESYRHADAGVLAPFTYVSMIWALIIGFFAFGEIPTLPMLGGAALVIGAGAAIMLRERQLGMQNTAERKVATKEF